MNGLIQFKRIQTCKQQEISRQLSWSVVMAYETDMWCEVKGEEGGYHAPLCLLAHVLRDLVEGDMTRPLVHDLCIAQPCQGEMGCRGEKKISFFTCLVHCQVVTGAYNKKGI